MTHRFSSIVRLGLVCAVAGAGLHAERPRLGVQALSSWPTGSMKSQFTDGTGYGLGAFAAWEVDAGRQWRLAYDGVVHPSRREGVTLPIPGAAGADARREFRSHALTLQYLYFPQRDSEGFYFIVGLGGMNYLKKSETTVRYTAAPAWDVTVAEETGTKLACVAGVGYEFGRSWGATARYSFLTVDNHTLGAVQAGLSYRF